MNKQIENELSASYGTGDPRKCIGFDATDCDDERPGIVESVWRDPGADAPFFNVRTGWLGLGKAYNIPTHRIHLDKRSYATRDGLVQAMHGYVADRASEGFDGMVREGTHGNVEVDEAVKKKSGIDVDTMRKALS